MIGKLINAEILSDHKLYSEILDVEILLNDLDNDLSFYYTNTPLNNYMITKLNNEKKTNLALLKKLNNEYETRLSNMEK